MQYNIADLMESIADVCPDRPALASGDVHLTFGELDTRANRLAHFFASRGVKAGDHVGLFLFNGHQYVETLLALMKIRAVGININYRFVAPEVRYMIDNADLRGIVAQRQFLPIIDKANEGMPPIPALITIEDGTNFVSSQETTDYEAAMAAGSPERGFAERSGDDLFIIYTGGTTGMPKGVMWRHEDLFFSGLQGGAPSGDPVETPEEVARNAAEENYCVSMLPCAPFIHGASQLTGFICLLTGGKLVIQPGKSFDPERVLDLIGEEEATTLTIVGDAMAYPLLEQLERTDKSFDVSHLSVIASAGAILSPTNKAKLQALLPDVMIINSFGSTESGDLGRAADDEQSVDGRPTFYMDESVTVLDEMLNPIEPGSGVIGRLARSGRLPLGYYKDEAQTNERFVTANGKRWVVPGDFATIEADGRITFMGRGSKCINTGGEKVFPEEVEEAIKAHPDVIDALVVGVPDPKWGSTVGAVFNTKGNKPLSNEDLQAHCRQHVAGYKVPRVIVQRPVVERFPSGKPDYNWAEAIAKEAAGITPQGPS
ncbi:MAG: acyl-CoA synthetase [Sandaracinaceae bacterium]|nr:acyl-CoA synthetase [Sandaracinaceae bacterium]